MMVPSPPLESTEMVSPHDSTRTEGAQSGHIASRTQPTHLSEGGFFLRGSASEDQTLAEASCQPPSLHLSTISPHSSGYT